MALVAYDTNSDSEVSEDDDVEENKVHLKEPRIEPSNNKVEKDGGEISDEEDFYDPQSSGIFEEEPDLISLITQKLPNAKIKIAQKSYVDETEDVTAIPTKKDYGEKVEEPPAKKKKRTGPVQIMLPALADLTEDDEEKEAVKIQPSKTGSGLFSLLPPPKNKMNRPNRSSHLPPSPAASQPSQSSSQQNLKPQGVRKIGLVPHRVANPVKATHTKPKSGDNSDEDSDDDYLGVNSGSYFPTPSLPTTSKYKKVNPIPLQPSLPANSSFVSLNMANDSSATFPGDQDLGPAVAPYPPPAPNFSTSSSSNLVDNDEAIMRLAGKQNKLKEMKEDGETGGLNIIDLHEDDMKGDPRVWLTKAMTEETAPRPTGKGPKGLAKTRHHITYLAHQAKERDWELKQEWATARENRKASMNKYGFI